MWIVDTETSRFLAVNEACIRRYGYSREEFLERAKTVPQFTLATLTDAGHMLHHDQPEALAQLMAGFLLPS